MRHWRTRPEEYYTTKREKETLHAFKQSFLHAHQWHESEREARRSKGTLTTGR